MNGVFQVSDFHHYEALYMLIETYIRERDEQNPYDYVYSLEMEEENDNEGGQGSRQDARRSRTSIVSYYADGAAANVPTEDVTVADGERQRASGRAVSIESFYSDEVEDADDEDAGTGAGASNTNVVVDSYYVNPVPK